jgi:S-adenosylmethionine hydrolase
VVHRVIAGLAPAAPVVDLTHQVPPFDVRAGALTLWRVAPWLTPGVILAVVDPGVGTPRRAVAIDVGASGVFLVGPDNGLLVPAALRLGAITEAVDLGPGPESGATFDGRDVFAPAAARLATGAPLASLGPSIDPVGLAGEAVQLSTTGPDGVLRSRVLWVDRFGNVEVDADPTAVARLRSPLMVGDRPARWVRAFGQLDAGEMGVYVDAFGVVALCCNRGSAADLTGLRPGDEVALAAASAGRG